MGPLIECIRQSEFLALSPDIFRQTSWMQWNVIPWLNESVTLFPWSLLKRTDLLFTIKDLLLFLKICYPNKSGWHTSDLLSLCLQGISFSRSFDASCLPSFLLSDMSCVTGRRSKEKTPFFSHYHTRMEKKKSLFSSPLSFLWAVVLSVLFQACLEPWKRNCRRDNAFSTSFAITHICSAP